MAAFDSFYMATIIPPIGVWSIIFGLSKLPFLQSDQQAFIKKLAIVSSSFCFGILFSVFALLTLEGLLKGFFIFIGTLIVLYSFVIYNSFD
ncbi:MAG: hypothetical protein AABX51_02620 [Nanoarchaeota archaeon]